MDFQLIIGQIVSLFILIFIGYYLRKINYLNENNMAAISKLLMNLILPAMIISSLQMELNKNLISNMKTILIYWFIFYIFLIITANLITKLFSLPKSKKIIVKFLLIFGNIGYMGIPVADALLPENGLAYAALGLIPFNIIVWTYGIRLFINDSDELDFNFKSMFNNGLIAIFIGLFLMITGLKLPLPLESAVDMLGNATFPLSMLVIGSSLEKIQLRGIFTDINLIVFSIIKLLIIPAAAFLVLFYFEVDNQVRTILTLQMGMPAASYGVIFAEIYNGDYTYAAKSLFVSTLFSALTIPVISYFII
ncbi:MULTISPECIES: AEC family transporter [unclassified Halanaerobium]|uniref:AEC family transporter n=1 Tax=unclassified Halanaerobium TaxID=2641197 RepID=UPI000E159BD2|nr:MULTISPECIES: AEC family transporter [unclassified Halanaerobium]RCW49207.1 hypothetical protein DFR78_10610 [Halanaerobium sp. MA284_MarDTE_T2]RCW82962.1 hypothetical protein DER71_11832 [Halanaerobium sp. DL-01]